MPDSVDFAMRMGGFIASMVAGTLSACCSLLILYLIWKSMQKLSTTYHRVMGLMSIFDFIASTCMALSTLPMPSDNVVDFEGPMIGNKRTCQVQGYFIVFGMAGGGSLYMCLSWYFVLSITFKMKLDTIKRWVEPLFYLYSIVLALFLSTFFLAKDLIQSSTTDPFCIVAPEYSFCNYTSNGDYKCYFDSFEFSTFVHAKDVIMCLVAVNIALVLIAMIIVLVTVIMHTKGIRSAVKKQATSKSNDAIDEDASVTNENSVEELRYSRTMITQALMYIAAYFLTWMFMIIPMAVTLGRSSSKTVMWFDGLKTVLFPLQGFWNLIIFVFDKAYIIRLTTDSRSWCQAVKKALQSPEQTSEVHLTNFPSIPDTRSRRRGASTSTNVEDDALSQIGSLYDHASNSSPSLNYSNALSTELPSQGAEEPVSRYPVSAYDKAYQMYQRSISNVST
jgi:hypothetical protein